eukprot:c28044_g1_i2 orf=408-3386(-)
MDYSGARPSKSNDLNSRRVPGLMTVFLQLFIWIILVSCSVVACIASRFGKLFGVQSRCSSCLCRRADHCLGLARQGQWDASFVDSKSEFCRERDAVADWDGQWMCHSEDVQLVCSNYNAVHSSRLLPHGSTKRILVSVGQDRCHQSCRDASEGNIGKSDSKSLEADVKHTVPRRFENSAAADASSCYASDFRIFSDASKERDITYVTAWDSPNDPNDESNSRCPLLSEGDDVSEKLILHRGLSQEVLQHEQGGASTPNSVKDQEIQEIEVEVCAEVYVPNVKEKGINVVSKSACKYIHSHQSLQEITIGNVAGDDLQGGAEQKGQEPLQLYLCEICRQGDGNQSLSTQTFMEHSANMSHRQDDVSDAVRKLCLEDNLEGSKEEEEDSTLEEIESQDGVNGLREALRAERKAMSVLYSDLEEERKAAEIAANEAMAMISKLQEEKAAMLMQAAQYQRMVEEKSMHDQQSMAILRDALLKREKERFWLVEELEFYREKHLLEKAYKMRGARISRRKQALCTQPVQLVKGMEEELGSSEKQQSDKIIETDFQNVNHELKFTIADKKPKGATFSGVENFDGKAGTCNSASSSILNQNDERKQSRDEDVDKLREGSCDALSGSYFYQEAMNEKIKPVFSAKDEEIQFILKHLQVIEEHLKEADHLGTCNPGSSFLEIDSQGAVQENGIKRSRNFTMEQINVFSGDTSSSPRIPALSGVKTKADCLESIVQDTSYRCFITAECNQSGTADIFHPSSKPAKEASSSSSHQSEVLTQNEILPVHGGYEVQHGSEQSKWYSLASQCNDFFKGSEQCIVPDLLPGYATKDNSQSAEFSKPQDSISSEAKNLFSLHDVDCPRWNDNADWNSCSKQCRGNFLSLDVSQLDFHTKAMIIRNNRLTMLKEEVQELNRRLQALESGREPLGQSQESLKHKDARVDLFQWIVLHLRELKKKARQPNDTGDILQLESFCTPSLQSHIPVLKKHRYSSEPGQTQETVNFK